MKKGKTVFQAVGMQAQVQEALKERPDLARYVSQEKSVTEILSRRKLWSYDRNCDIKISSADLDSAFETPKSPDTQGHFQRFPFDPNLRGTNPKAFLADAGESGND